MIWIFADFEYHFAKNLYILDIFWSGGFLTEEAEIVKLGLKPQCVCCLFSVGGVISLSVASDDVNILVVICPIFNSLGGHLLQRQRVANCAENLVLLESNSVHVVLILF